MGGYELRIPLSGPFMSLTILWPSDCLSLEVPLSLRSISLWIVIVGCDLRCVIGMEFLNI